ncbi:unnamed protein product (mitochondrion) [Plasmodiophora brassicae]|uniref:EF-hand domain-containing protein n=1 Tax=Plasmodiophora brassicae TaxID=37360 RepID=A0A0G4INF1_PLABS|nr:hypothetical protein PBRA_005299 [Plasmodiophora brassicae]SPQ95359.1 unnamed protein product [Plasmodiophora brassicae]
MTNAAAAAFAIDEVFGIIDASATGRVDADNLLPILSRIGIVATRKQVHEMMVASFGAGTLNPTEFKKVLERPTAIEADQDTEAAELLWAMSQIAIDGSEFIQVKTLHHYLTLFGLDLPEAQFSRVFAGLHIEANGTIEFREVINHILSNRTYLRK